MSAVLEAAPVDIQVRVASKEIARLRLELRQFANFVEDKGLNDEFAAYQDAWETDDVDRVIAGDLTQADEERLDRQQFPRWRHD